MLISSAFAQDAGSIPPPPDIISTIMPLVLIFVVMYFILIRPQQAKAKKHKAMLAALRRGDIVVTGGGVIGKVNKVIDEENVEVEIAENLRVKVVRATLLEVRAKTEPVDDAKDVGDKKGGGKKTSEGDAKKPGLMSHLSK
jgi:preprotein translocase subunit YajC